jgi:pilus assembly protein CpaB
VRRLVLIFVVALVAAVGATLGIRGALDAPKRHNRIETRHVVISLRDIPQGDTIDRASVTVAEWPRVTVPNGAYEVTDSVIGRVARNTIFRGEAIVPARLVADGGLGARK